MGNLKMLTAWAVTAIHLASAMTVPVSYSNQNTRTTSAHDEALPTETALSALRMLTPDDCTFFDAAWTADDDCQYFADNWDISVEDFIAWNPEVGADCSNIQVGQEYCVERNSGLPVPSDPETSTSTTTSTKVPEPTTNVPSPVQPGIIDTCTLYYKAVKGDTCDKIVNKYQTFTVGNFISWNPAVEDDCSGLWAETYYCVAIPGTPTSPLPPVPITTTTGVPKPSPTQDGLIESCTTFYKAVKGDTCAAIVRKYGTFSLGQFISWNPAVERDCTSLWAETYYCVGVPGTPTTRAPSVSTSTKATTTTRGNGVATPTPTQPDMLKSCASFYFVKQGDTCQQIAARHGISEARFRLWNPSVGEDCTGLWANAYVCIRSISFVAPIEIDCYTSSSNGKKTWGDNKSAALSRVGEWCGGNGSGRFNLGQTKRGCFNAPFGTNRFEFSMRNGFGITQSLSVSRCNEIVRAAVNRCDRGGNGLGDSWTVDASVVAGRC